MLFKVPLLQKKQLKASSIFLLLLIVITSGLMLLFSLVRNYHQINNQANDFTQYRSDLGDIGQVRQEIKKMVTDVGGAEAYRLLQLELADKSLEYQHDAAHIFGEQLYQSEGLAGLKVCDHSLLNGCFHGFLLSAVAQEGVQIISQIDQACTDSGGDVDLACQHGIGHGLGEYFGPQNLNQQFETCLTLSWKKPVGGCVGGAIMEYHFPSLLGVDEEIIGIKEFNPERPYQPCDELKEKFKNSCAYYIPRWWKNTMDYQQIGQLCAGFVTANQQWYCFHGAGYIAAHFTEFDVEQTKQLCDQMPTQSARLWCRMSAAWSFETSPEEIDRQLWPELCQDLDGDEAQCLSDHDFDFVIPLLPDIPSN